MNAADGLMDYDLRLLQAALPGVTVVLLERAASTQAHAAAWLEAAGDEAAASLPAMVVAARQTQGVGRGGRRWLSDEGSIAVTYLFASRAGEALLELPLRSGLAVRQAIGRWVKQSSVQIKWPNDVLVEGRKIAGVLCQQRRGVNLIGVGVNVHVDVEEINPFLQTPATSLHEHVGACGRGPDTGEHERQKCDGRREPDAFAAKGAPGRQQVLIELTRAMLSLWEREDWLQQLSQAHALTGRDVVVDTSDGPVAGLCEGVDEQGRLLVRTGGVVHHLYDGTVRK